MLIVLPNEIDGLEKVEKSLETLSLKSLRRNRFLKEVDLYLPKFRVESTIELNNVLEEVSQLNIKIVQFKKNFLSIKLK